MEKIFQKVYPFTTEMISGYMSDMEVDSKKILTVGSSIDQAFNAILLGANDVTIVDINENTKDFYERKKDILLSSTRDEFYDKVLSLNEFSYAEEVFPKRCVNVMNLYMQSDLNFEVLKEKLRSISINFITDDIFKMDNVSDTYDRIFFSNILQNMYAFYDESVMEEQFMKSFNKWVSLLNDKGLLQLLYIYSYYKGVYSSDLTFKIAVNNLSGLINLCTFDSFDSTDAIVVYEKKVK